MHKTCTVVEFTRRGAYRTSREPLTVIANATVLGTWYPAGTEPGRAEGATLDWRDNRPIYTGSVEFETDRFPISEAEEKVVGKPADYDWEHPIKRVAPPTSPDPSKPEEKPIRQFRPVPKPGTKK